MPNDQDLDGGGSKSKVRTKKNARAGPGPSSSSSSSSKIRPRPIEERDSVARGVPGVSKLKAQIRQTKRLLAKDNIEPGLRISTQRRLVSLESDLVIASRRDLEKRNGAKYHMVKFFERRKLERIIKRAQRTLGKTGTSSKERKAAEEELEQARVMLNYVIHYPNTDKYIALFKSSANDHTQVSDSALTLPPLLKTTPENMDGPTRARFDRLLEIQELMKSGKMSQEPEVEVGKPKKRLGIVNSNVTKSTKSDSKEAAVDNEEQDDFFDDDEE